MSPLKIRSFRIDSLKTYLPIRVILALLFCIGLSAHANPVITEFMSSNDETLQDEDGESPDWIEIHNPTAASISLSGWYLTDSAEVKNKWQFPAVNLAAGGYLVVFASDKDRTTPGSTLHTNFKLSTGGEYLALVHPDGVTVQTEFAPEYPEQSTDVSYGTTQPTSPGEEPVRGFFVTATPGTANGGADSLLVIDPVLFSRTSGLFFEDTTVALSGADTGEVIRYKLVAPSAAGAEFDNPTVDDPAYSGPIALTDSVVIRAAIFSTDGSRIGPMTTHHYLRADNSTVQRVDTFSSQLPLVVIDNHGFGLMDNDGITRPSWMYTFEPGENGTTSLSESPALVGGLELRVRGQSSSLHPKRSYKWDFIDSTGNKVELEIPGMGKFNEWAMIGPWNWDRSNFRNAFVYGLSNDMERWAPGTKLVEVFVNLDGDALEADDYVGIYTITDQIELEPGRLDITEIDDSDNSGEDLTGGYILEIDEPDPDKYSWESDNGFPGIFTSVLLVDSPKVDDITPEQIDYIQSYVQSMENALFLDQSQDWRNRAYLQYIDRSSWIDYHLLNTFVKNTDTFWRSFKFYKDRGERLVSGPVWDYDRSIDSADPRDNDPLTWNLPGNTDQGFGVQYWSIGWWGILAQDPEFMQGWFDRWQQLRAGPFSNGILTNRIDELAAQIGPDAAARELTRWPTNQSEHGSYENEVANMKSWLTQRGSWIDGMLVAVPQFSNNSDGSTTVSPATGSELIYTTDGGDPRLSNGDVAPDAIRTTEAVTFPADSKFRARAYNALLGAWPGTKWSRAIPGDIGTPFKPSPRMVNLSSRARVGSGDNIVVSGLVINESDNKSILLRGVGPTLAEFGVTDALAQPVLQVFNSDGEEVARNSGWDSGTDASRISKVAESVGAFPLTANSGDAALLLDLPVGRYSVHLSSGNGEGGTALTEAYEIDDIGSLLNISVRGTVNGTSSPMIAGFVVTGDQAKRVLVRGIGPTLSSYGVTDPLANPTLQIAAGADIIAENNDWHATDAELITTSSNLVGAFGLDEGSQDAAILVTLQPGVYTAIVSGAENTTGTTLVEVYELE